MMRTYRLSVAALLARVVACAGLVQAASLDFGTGTSKATDSLSVPPRTAAPAKPAAPKPAAPKPVVKPPEQRTAASFDLTTLVDRTAAEAMAKRYLHNDLAVTYLGPATWNEQQRPAPDGKTPPPRVRVTADFLPANAPFHLAVVGTPADAAGVEAIREAATAALPDDLRRLLTSRNMLGPVLQWFLRRHQKDLSAAGVVQAKMAGDPYLGALAHPATFLPGQFDLEALTNAAARLTVRDIPAIVHVAPIYDEYERDPWPQTVPGRDFADPQPEETYATPFSIAYVLRAPETKRRFRFCARTWGGQNLPLEYAWKVLRGRGLERIQSYTGDRTRSPEKGFAEILINRRYMSPRLDVAVFSRLKGGVWGPPAFISFYQPPDAKADYYKSGLLREIAYQSAVVADDPFRKALRPLFTPRAWTDTFEFDEKGNVCAFSRRRTGTVFADRFFRATGEKILESWSSGMPKKTQPVEYFVNAEGFLDYRDVGDPVSHSLR